MLKNFFFLLILSSIAARAQFTFSLDQQIAVKDLQGNDLAMPWAGGLNAAQYNTMDLNGDGKDDLVLFDRMANKVITLLNDNNKYRHAPEFEYFFPEDISNLLLLRDYNCDGKKDIFTADVLGIKVYTNITPPGENLQWKQFFFYSGPGSKSPVILTKGFTAKINLQIQFDDLPSIVDADGDGDLDIFNVRFVGNGTVEYHQNFSKERYGTCDSLDFERITQTWGNFKECHCETFAFNGADCPPSGGRTKHAGGKSLLAFDANGDQKIDILFSESSCKQLYLLSNQGTTLNPIVNNSSSFPQPNPVDFSIFPSAFYEDVDFDGVKDLISTPNIFAKEFLTVNLQQSNWFYKNTGTTSAPSFLFIKNNFLQDQMIDVGDNAIPAFADHDGDQDYDMFISRNSPSGSSSTIFLYENIGTPEAPAFKLASEDYQNFSARGFYNLKIQFTDINGDNTSDLVFTATSFVTSSTKLYFIANKSSSALDFSGQSAQMLSFNLTYNENLCITDVNTDGLPDILAGRNTGALEFWKNTGMPAAPVFTLEDTDYLKLETSVLRQNVASASADLDNNGQADLLLGDQSGRLQIIRDYKIQTNPIIETEVIFNPIEKIYTAPNLGGRIWPAVVNLFKSDKPVIVAGNILGGVQILRNEEDQSLPVEPQVDIYPNPLERNETLNIVADRPVQVQIISLLGQQLTKPVHLRANDIYHYKLPFLSPGMYLLQFFDTQKSCTRRLVIQ